MPKAASGFLPAMVLGAVVLVPGVPGEAQAQVVRDTVDARTPDTTRTLAGCRLPLPGEADLDSGLAGIYVSDRQGSPYLLAPSLSIRQTYSDNLFLAPEGEEDSGWVTQLIPAFSFCRVRPRLRTQFDYQARALQYWSDSDRNDVYHRVSTDNTATLVTDTLFLDFGARYDLEPRFATSVFADDNILDLDDDRDEVLDLYISPYLEQDLGRLGDSVVRYTLERSIYEDDSIRNTTRQIVDANLLSPGETDPWSWEASIRTERVDDRRRDEPVYFDDTFGELGYRVIGGLQLIGRLGLESRPRVDGRTDRFSEGYWAAGFRWADARTSVEALYGERFFGETYLASVTRRAPQNTFTLSYRETQQISDRFIVLGPGAPGTVDPDTGEFIAPVFLTENEIFVSKRGTATNTYTTGRSTIRASAYYDRREFEFVDEQEDALGVDFYWRWQWLPRTAVIPRVSWERIEARDGREDTLRGARISLARLLDRRTQAGVTIRRQDRSSDDPDREYTEHAISLTLTRLF